MESRKQRRAGIRASRVTGSAYPNITDLIESGGQISLGALPPIKCAAVANDDYNCLAMLKRRPAERYSNCSNALMQPLAER